MVECEVVVEVEQEAVTVVFGVVVEYGVMQVEVVVYGFVVEDGVMEVEVDREAGGVVVLALVVQHAIQ